MTTPPLNRDDPLDDFDHRDITLLGSKHRVYVTGSGPAVIVMTEMPGISPHVARFARWVRGAGFTVYMPHIFGRDGAVPRAPRMLFTMIGGCISRQFRAFQAMRLLEERGMGRFGSVFENLESTYERWGVYALELYREFALTPLVRRAKNEFGQWTQQQFLKSDLSMDVDIRVESGSVRPKSSISKLDAMQRLQAMGALDARYPEQRLRMLEESGMLSMIPGVERDTEAAMRENAEFLRWARGMQAAMKEMQGPEELARLMEISKPPVTLSLLVDEHINHFLYHRRFALSDEYRSLPDPFKRWWEDVHLAGHLDAYQQLIARGGVPGMLPPLMPQQTSIAPPKPLDANSSRV